MLRKIDTGAVMNEDTSAIEGKCAVCRKPLDSCASTITIAVDRERAMRIYHYFFSKEYRYCSLRHATKFYESWPDLSADYLTVTKS